MLINRQYNKNYKMMYIIWNDLGKIQVNFNIRLGPRPCSPLPCKPTSPNNLPLCTNSPYLTLAQPKTLLFLPRLAWVSFLPHTIFPLLQFPSNVTAMIFLIVDSSWLPVLWFSNNYGCLSHHNHAHFPIHPQNFFLPPPKYYSFNPLPLPHHNSLSNHYKELITQL